MMTLGLRTYPKDVVGIDRVLAYNYWNQGGVGIVIVAREGRADDWAAYIGAFVPPLDGSHSEEEAIAWAAARGAKLVAEQAARWFSQLPIKKYRR